MIKNAIFNGSLNFKLINKPKRTVSPNKKLSKKLITGLCIKTDEGEYKIRLKIDKVKEYITVDHGDTIIDLPFTEESYELKGVISVFGREKVDGRWVRYIRNENQCKFFPGSKEKLVPFRPGWDCNGYVVKRDGKLMFEFNDCLGLEGCNIIEHDEEE